MGDGDGSRDEPFSERWIWGMWGRSFHGLPTTLIFYATKPHAMHGQLGGWMEGRKSLGLILDGILGLMHHSMEFWETGLHWFA